MILNMNPASTTSEPTSEYWFIFQNDQLLILLDGDTNQLLTLDAIDAIKHSLIRQYSLSSTVFCAEMTATVELPVNIEAIPLRAAFTVLGNNWFSTAVKAYSIITWDKNNQYCGRCGQPTTLQLPFERICSTCHLHFYPRISPSVIVRIQKGNEILMARSPHFSPGVYGLIAGFVEVGETLEETVKREVQEEVGIQIKNLTYFSSQPWPFPDSLMIAFTADYASGDLTVNHAELEDAGWYTINNMPGYPTSSISVSAQLIEHFIRQQKKDTL